MFALPKSVKLRRNKRAEAKLYEQSRELLGDNQREGLHASDLLDPLQTYWRKLKPIPPTEREVMFFLIGRVQHEMLLGHEDGGSEEEHIHDDVLGIIYTPDKLTKKGEPIELKTSRAMFEAKKVLDIDNYIEQLLIYMAARKKTTGYIQILYMNLREDPDNKYNRTTRPQFRFYKVTISEEDLEAYREQIKETSTALKEAIEKEDPSGLPLCRKWKCGYGNCPYWSDCKPKGRHGKKAKKDWEA